MATAVRPLNGESYSLNHLSSYASRSSPLLRKPSPSQFPVPPGAPPWPEKPQQTRRRRTMEDLKIKPDTNGRLSPYTLSVAAEFSLKRANKQLLAMGETLESVKSELSPNRETFQNDYRTYSRASSAPISPVTTYVPRSSDGFFSSGDMLSDMRKLAMELRSLRESIDPARRGSVSSRGSSRASTPLTSPRTQSRFRNGSVEIPRTSPRHSRHSSLSGLRTVREEAPVIEVQSIRGSAVGQPSAVVRIFRTPQQNGKAPSPRIHGRSLSESNGIRIRHFDRNGHETYASSLLSPYLRPMEERPESEMSMVSESSYHTAFQEATSPTIDVDEILRNRRISDISDRISDTATIGRPVTPVTQVRTIGVNTEDIGPAENIPPHALRQRPSRAALLSNIRGCQDGILIGKVHAAVDKLAVQLASTQSVEEENELKQRLQTALDLLEEH
jgi:hypothetical protein